MKSRQKLLMGGVTEVITVNYTSAEKKIKISLDDSEMAKFQINSYFNNELNLVNRPLSKIIQDNQSIIGINTNLTTSQESSSNSDKNQLGETMPEAFEPISEKTKIEGLKNEKINKEIQKALERLKYSFKSLNFDTNTFAITTNYSGRIKSVEWDFNDDRIKIRPILAKNYQKEIDLEFYLEAERGKFDWRKPFEFMIVKSPDAGIEKKIYRDSRFSEKMNKLSGGVSIRIKNSIIDIEIEKKATNLKPAINLIKELGWLLDITLN